MNDQTHSDIVVVDVGGMTDRQKLEAVAASYQDLMELEAARRAHIAKMIRVCVQRIERTPGPFDDAHRRAKIVLERRQAITALQDLSCMLAGETR